ncbi:ABC transporter permease [Pontibacter akesuensis]|uniref:Duplicated orphan permease n=1 Tax=Pontibacter akesuensis TaxID=388950 RepID=A0A1I7K7B1_9BACT|nr:ABC transporter permease [Pontibacter akesuensis]GHA74582.1 ABC transporter permease [Pontibacter akesuensis]SFU93252.1 duplicated orphan permease [Pontibacter akesuensis]
MLKNYLKIAYRNLLRHKVFSLINVLGLALGMTCSILILLWVQDELSYDRFHANTGKLYRVMGTQHYPGADDLTTPAGPGRLGPAMEEELPEVEDAIRVTWYMNSLFSNGDKSFKAVGYYADDSFFEAFTFPLIHGDAKQVLKQPKSIVISDSIAQKFFGTNEAVGKMLKLNNSESYKVTGVMKSVPQNSSLQFDFIMPFNDYLQQNEWLKEWGNYGILTYVQLKPDVDVAAFNNKIKLFLKQGDKGERDTDLFVQAVEDMHLYSDFRPGKTNSGLVMYVQLFSVVAVFILLIACINFMNLATARSAKRAKEVGVRKAIGASKQSLIKQFMVESVLIAFLALFIAANLTGILLPAFNDLTGKAVQFDLSDPSLILLLLGVALFTGIVSGSYPAFFLSSFNPAVVLKGTVKLNDRVTLFRKGLVVFQFILSALLIVSTLVVYLQLHFIRTTDIGLQRENMVYIPIEGQMRERYDVIKQEVQQIPGVLAVTASDNNPLTLGSNTSDVEWPGKVPGAEILIDYLHVDYGYLDAHGIKLKDGRDFSREFGTDTANYIINEEAARLMQLENPVGQPLKLWDVSGQIIGVVKNFQSRKMEMGDMPLIIKLAPENTRLLFARVAPGKTTSALASMEDVLQKHNPAFPFEYHFMDDTFEQMYRSESVIGELTNYFAGIAIFISCLGLFGLALFTAEQRKKEIGVRKVLGASVSGIVFMLSKDFLKLVLLANIVALPLSWYLMNAWLNDYAVRTELSWWIFAIALLATFAIAMFTLSFHAIKTAVANPVNSLRSE